jgi:hypothetical protein
MPWNPNRGWRSWKTPHLTLYTNTLYEYGPALDWLEDAHAIFQNTFFRDQPIPPGEVVYFADSARSPFLTNGGQYKYGVMIARFPWTEAHGGHGLLMVGNYSWQWGYQHVLAHHFIEAAVPRAPLWFHEGFARYLAGAAPIAGRPGNICFGQSQPAFTTRVTLPLRELLAANYHEYNQSSAPWIGPLSHSFIDFLIHGEDGRLRPRFSGLMRELAAGKSGEEALAAVYPEIPLDRLDAAFRDHVRSLRPMGQACPLSAPLPPPGPRAAAIKTPVSEEEIRALFQGLEQISDRDGYADFFPDPLPPAPKTAAP